MIDFVKLCRDKNIDYLESGHHHCAEGWIQVHCLFCSDGSHGWHLGFNLEFGNFNCWRCGSHSAYDYLIQKFMNQSESGKALYRQYQTNSILAPAKKKIKRKRKAKQPPYLRPLGNKHKKYLKGRKFNPDKLVEEWGLECTLGLSGNWSWRIVAPIVDQTHNVVAYTGRALHKDVRPRWLTSNDEDITIEPKKLLYGIDKVYDSVLIVEGISDVWRMGPGAVAMLGIDWKEEQAAILKNFTNRFIMFDPEGPAQKRAEKLAHWLAPFSGSTELITGLKSDPGNLSQKKANKIMNELGII